MSDGMIGTSDWCLHVLAPNLGRVETLVLGDSDLTYSLSTVAHSCPRLKSLCVNNVVTEDFIHDLRQNCLGLEELKIQGLMPPGRKGYIFILGGGGR